jgi:hypothetical protein
MSGVILHFIGGTMGNWGPSGYKPVKTLGARGNTVSGPNTF